METLIKKRGTSKGKLTIFAKYLASVEAKFPDYIITQKASFLELELRCKNIESELSVFDEVQSEIESLAQDDEDQLQEREQFTNNFYGSLARAKAFTLLETTVSSSSNLEHGIDLRNFNNDAQHLNNIKLPTIQLKKFGGNFDHWLEFRDVFNSLIHENATISNVQKFHYLRASLEGGAAEIIRSLEFSEANYETAWSLICSRYNNERILVNNHVSSIFNLENIREESSSSLRSLLDNLTKHMRALEILKEPTDSWDTLIIYLVVKKLDSVTARQYEEFKSQNNAKPTLEGLKGFLSDRADLLETIERSSKIAKKPANKKIESKTNSFVSSATSACAFCNESHFISTCKGFLDISTGERYDFVKANKLCINCLRLGHNVNECHSGSCKTCQRRHHTLLHFGRNYNTNNQHNGRGGSTQERTSGSSSRTTISHMSSIGTQIILGRALVKIFDKFNKAHLIRVLLDSGSQSSFITKEISDRLNLKRQHIDAIRVSGLNERTLTTITNKLDVVIQSNVNNYILKLPCLIVPQITNYTPSIKFNASTLNIPSHISLADSGFNIPAKIDMIIGAEWFWELLCVGQIKLENGGPILQKTKLGWIIAGSVPINENSPIQCHLSIEKTLAKFWELEEVPSNKSLSKNEKYVESHFQNNFKRNEEGRFIVDIPFKENIQNLSNTYEIAKRRFLNLEKRFRFNETFKQKYFAFMNEYQTLNHMVKVETPCEQDPVGYYLPHHGVLKEDSTTTKLRVVFDGSVRGNSGVSLNEAQFVGPTIQHDLLSILLRFRKHNYVIASDIEKMYRMVLINPEQASLQRILFRFNENKPLNTYQLLTVTYGTASASYLAIRSLYQLGIEQETVNPRIAETIKNDFYVDDLLSGSDSIENTIQLANQVSRVLKTGCFNLRKWVSNSTDVLNGIESDSTSDMVDFGVDQNTKTLGLIWNSNLDSLSFRIKFDLGKQVTKRTVLSETAQIFDPLGLLGPCTIVAKLIMQDLWSEKVSWDESLPSALHTKWLSLRDDFSVLNNLQIKRQICCRNPKRWELHGFADASQRAYGSCIYLRTVNAIGEVSVKLVCVKSKVAPLKPLTIPRLELSAALLLAKTAQKVVKSLKIPDIETFYWSDSTIVLSWLKMEPNQLQTFVSNRVNTIQELSNIENWRHVPTMENPSDCVSRGVMPSILKHLELYWNGPKWLKLDRRFWPRMPGNNEESIPEIRTKLVCNMSKSNEAFELFNRFSEFTKLIRVVAYIFRFKHNVENKQNKRTGPLRLQESNFALKCLLKLCQGETFENEIRDVSLEKINFKSPLAKLNPFIDRDGLLRCGGRLSNSNFQYEKRCPILLSSKHIFTKMLFKHYHLILLHAGPQLLLATIRDRYWPLSGRNLSRQTVHNCIRCFKNKPESVHPIMGNLPERRLTPAPPFYTTGCDYAGPFLLKNRRGRGAVVSKCYISLFVCFVTKAVHLELVSDLSSEAFIASLRRFVARRGKPNKIYSDNGTNYTGANSKLRELSRFLKIEGNNLENAIQNDGIDWSFIPPHSPHFGGLWEAGIKSVKYHLRRIAGDASLTFEQFVTLLAQIEATLNSRPLHPLSSDPSDLAPLTPSHFLIGRPMTALPDPDLTAVPATRLSHFQQVQRLQQHFWTRWRTEYIHELQQRQRWKFDGSTLNVNDLVLIKEDNLPPLKWCLGRVEELIFGKDNIVRVAIVRTQKGLLKRNLRKLCPLPVSA